MAMEQSRVTHAHPIAQVCCALYAEIARLLLLGEPVDHWPDLAASAASSLRRHPLCSPEHHAALDVVLSGQKALPTGSGYCVSTFWAAIWALDRRQNYIGSVRLVVSLGGDTDTLACVVGGLSALAQGLASVPHTWAEALVVPAESRALLDRLSVELPAKSRLRCEVKSLSYGHRQRSTPE